MEYQGLINEIKKGVFHPVYVLHGEESWYIDQIAGMIEKSVLTEAEKSFNQTILYGKDTDYLTLMDVARRFPMMAKYQVVILREAQAMRDFDRLAEYVVQPVPTTILVICHKRKKIPQNKKAGKAIVNNSVSFYSPLIRNYKIPDWIAQYLSAKGKTISEKGAVLLEEYLGNDLSKIANSLEKLTLNLGETNEITLDAIEKYIGISKDYNVFELNNALTTRNVLKANRIANYFRSNPKAGPMPVVLATLYSLFSKTYLLQSLSGLSDQQQAKQMAVNPFFLKDYKTAARLYDKTQLEAIIGMLSDYDLQSKGVHNAGTEGGALLQELVYKILHV